VRCTLAKNILAGMAALWQIGKTVGKNIGRHVPKSLITKEISANI
jgi:hypothetical protein